MGVILFKYGTIAVVLGWLAGCAAVNGRPDPTLNTQKSIDALSCSLNLDGNITAYNKAGASETDKRSARDMIIDNGIALIDARYEQFVNDFSESKKETDTFAEVGSIGLNAAASLFAPATTVRILSALAGGVTAANASFNKNFYYEKTILVLIRQMDASRQKALVNLLNGRKEETKDYSLSDALADLGRYYQAGTFEGSLDAITQSAAETQMKADKDVHDIRVVTISWQAWIEKNGKMAAIDTLLKAFNALPADSTTRTDVLATATGVAIQQYLKASPDTLNIIFGTADLQKHSFLNDPTHFEPYLRDYANVNTVAEILGTKSLGLTPPSQ